jgi:uncharacterized protein with HEPN domain
MRPEQSDASYLWDMLQAAREACGFVEGLSFAEYTRNRMLQLAVERSVEIIGEAANRVSPAFQATHPDLPWSGMVAQRNVLVHDYADIEHMLLWSLVTEHLPPLITQLEELTPSPPAEPEP